MKFVIVRPNGAKESRRHIPYTVKQTGQCEWTAYTESGRVLGRNHISEENLRSHCDTCTEPA